MRFSTMAEATSCAMLSTVGPRSDVSSALATGAEASFMGCLAFLTIQAF